MTIAEAALNMWVKEAETSREFSVKMRSASLIGVGMKLSRPILLISAAIAVFVTCAVGVAQQTEEPQQIADPDFKPAVERPSYTTVGPFVVLDEAHGNFHTASGRYKPFADLLQADGYRVAAGAQPFTAAALQETQVLVIANALGSGITPANINDPPSAFADAECDAVRDWVRGGGSLLLIADHAPFGATAASLASRFGVEMGKGYAWTVSNNSPEPSTTIAYSRENGRLGDHAITRGITRVVAFTGQSLSVPSGATVLLRFGDGAYESTGADAQGDMEAFRGGKPHAARNITGRAQGIAFEYGIGRLVIMGEAAMFSAQVARFTDPSGRGNEIKMGMNVPGNDNRQFLLNIMHWLTRLGE